MDNNAKVATPNGLQGLQTVGSIIQSPQLTIMRVGNGYVITPPYYGGEQKVALLLNDMLDIVKTYFEDKSE